MSSQKLIPGPIKGFKGTDKNMKCKGFQFVMGENILNNNKDLVLCENGFHFCQQPSGPFIYERYDRIFKIEAYDILVTSFQPGAAYKQVCRKVVFLEEVKVGGDGNTGHWNTGDRNTGDGNTGDRNTDNWNTGHRNTGHGNTGHRNTGYWNTGDWNTGHRNTGDRNTGDRNTGHGNATNYSSGFFCKKETITFFDKPTKLNREDLNWQLIDQLCEKLSFDEPFDMERFLTLPNATKSKIKALHKEHIKRRQKCKE